MEYFVGVALAVGISVFSTLVGFDRHRAFYPTILIVVASYYGLFAVIGGSERAMVIESAIIALFVLASVVGFKFSLWIVAAALFGHGVLDFFHHQVVQNPGVPVWWPMFCMSYDCTAAVYLAWLLVRRKTKTA